MTIPEYLFSYGTLQLEAVQMATFGRLLAGTHDALPRFEAASIEIDDPTTVSLSGKTHHTIARYTGHDPIMVTSIIPDRSPFVQRRSRATHEAAAIARTRIGRIPAFHPPRRAFCLAELEQSGPLP